MAEEHGRPAGWRYRLHGFTVESAIELRGLVPADDRETAPDVTVRLAPVAEALDGAIARGACYAAKPREMMFRLPGTARFHVADGRTISIEATPAATRDAVCALLLSSPVAALLLQRGLLPLHASAVATAKGAVVFLGSAAVGKSTLVAALAQRGRMPLADDVTAVSLGAEGRPLVLPGYPLLRLWPDAIAALGLEPAASLLRPGVEKRLVSLPGEFPREPRPLVAIYVLSRGRRTSRPTPSARLSGAEAFAAVLDGVYRLAFAQGMGLGPQVFAQVAALARAVPVIPLEINRPPAELGRTLEEELAP